MVDCKALDYSAMEAVPAMTCSMVCNRSWHIPGYPKLVGHPARLIKEGGYHGYHASKNPLILFGFEGFDLSLPIQYLRKKSTTTFEIPSRSIDIIFNEWGGVLF